MYSIRYPASTMTVILNFLLIITIFQTSLAVKAMQIPQQQQQPQSQQQLEHEINDQQQEQLRFLPPSMDSNDLQLEHILMKRGNNLGRKLMCQIDHRNCRSYNEAKRMTKMDMDSLRFAVKNLIEQMENNQDEWYSTKNVQYK